MDGGTTSGYSEMGRKRSAIRPPKKISTDSTPAKIGRSMKKRERFTEESSVIERNENRRRAAALDQLQAAFQIGEIVRGGEVPCVLVHGAQPSPESLHEALAI